jgi:small subunit ribosomal protein S8
MVNDTIADFLARMQNGIMRGKGEVKVLKTRLIEDILGILKREGMIKGYEVREEEIIVNPLYKDREPAVSKFKRISSPGQRIYVNVLDIVPVMNGRGIAIISTSQGLMTGALAKSKGIGGEHICNIW